MRIARTIYTYDANTYQEETDLRTKESFGNAMGNHK